MSQESAGEQIQRGPQKQLRSRRIPLSWFYGGGRKDTGIQIVNFNENLRGLAGGLVGRYVDEWDHYRGNPVTEDDPEERRQRAQAAKIAAEELVAEVTGFTFDELNRKRRMFNRRYRGKFEAPFEVELY